MKTTFILILALLINVACRSQTSKRTVWTHAYRQQLINDLNITLKRRFPDSVKRAKLISYTVAQMELRLPKGLASVSADSLNKLSATIGKEYSYAAYAKNRDIGLTPTYVKWTNEIEKTIREVILKSWPSNDLKNGNRICDCVVKKLKRIYPEKILVPIQHQVIITIVAKCNDDLDN